MNDDETKVTKLSQNVTRFEKRDHLGYFFIIAKMCGRLLFFNFLFFGLSENVDLWLHSDMLCS